MMNHVMAAHLQAACEDLNQLPTMRECVFMEKIYRDMIRPAKVGGGQYVCMARPRGHRFYRTITIHNIKIIRQLLDEADRSNFDGDRIPVTRRLCNRALHIYRSIYRIQDASIEGKNSGFEKRCPNEACINMKQVECVQSSSKKTSPVATNFDGNNVSPMNKAGSSGTTSKNREETKGPSHTIEDADKVSAIK